MTEQSKLREGGRYRLDIDADLPLTRLIRERMDALGLSKAELARSMGYGATVEKGIRRIEALLAGQLGKAGPVSEKLAEGLAVDPKIVDIAASDTRYVLWARDDRNYRRDFAPHVVWETEQSRPSPITIAGMVNAQGRLYWYPGSIDPVRISDEALRVMPQGVPCYGKVTGYHVNYSPDCAVRFDTNGEPLEALDHAIRPGFAKASVDGRPLGLANSG